MKAREKENFSREEGGGQLSFNHHAATSARADDGGDGCGAPRPERGRRRPSRTGHVQETASQVREMLIDKPDWVSHGDGVAPIFSVDVHPDGNRLASAGGDGTVVLWSVGYMVSKLQGKAKNGKAKGKKKKKDDQAQGGSQQLGENREEKENIWPESANGNGKANGASAPSGVVYANAGVDRVATIADHRGKPVNVARFSHSGRFLASGGDNHLVLIHELRPTHGMAQNGTFGQFTGTATTTTFGSSVKNLENWVLCCTMTGHSNNVVDLGWSPDDSMVASCSLDNTVRIWDTMRGALITVLQEHTSFVKGVVWDPVGKYLASQSDDRSLVIRTVEGWETVSCIKEPFEKAVWNTFSTRLDWCPDGSHITAVNTYQAPKNTAAILMRGSWSRTHDYIGHKGPVVASRFNPRLFRVASDEAGGDKYVASCIALGAQDNKITVWLSRKARPVLVAKTFFNQSVVDLCWSPDGLTLFAASIDGTVAMFKFDEKELGERLSAREVQDIMKNSYGTARLDRMGVAEDPALMELEEEEVMAQPASATAKAKAAAPQQAAQAAKKQKVPGKLLAPRKPSAAEKSPAKKKRVEGGQGNANASTADVLVQRETIRPSDGKRRIAPVPLGAVGGGQAIQAPQQRSIASPKKQVIKKSKAQPGSVPRSPQREATTIIQRPQTVIIAPPPHNAPRLSARIAHERVCEIQNAEKDIFGVPRELRISAVVQCLEGTKKIWIDKHLGSTVQIACGREDFLALGLDKGILQVYSKQGRRMWPPLSLGAPLAFLEMKRVTRGGSGGTREDNGAMEDGSVFGVLLLLAVTSEGKTWVYEVESGKCVLHTDVVPVALGEGSHKVKQVRLSDAGLPLVVLDNSHALVYSDRFSSWARVADGSHLFSEFNTQTNAQSGAVAKTLAMVSASEQRRATGRHLEFMVQAAQALGEAKGNDWLGKLAKFLAQEGDQGKLREVLDDLLREGNKKRMKSVLAAIASVRSMQRLVSEYLDILGTMAN